MLNISKYYRVSSLEEALDLLNKETWKILGGGTDIVPQMRAGAHKDAALMDIQLLKNELGSVEMRDGDLVIGALCTHEELRHNDLVKEYMPTLADACAHVGSPQIRKRGTIAGNVINASPAGDTIPSLVAAGASARFLSVNGERLVPVEDIATRPGRTVKEDNELLTEFIIPLEGKAWKGTYDKVGVRNALQISIADCAVISHPDFGVRIACGSVGPTVKRALQSEALFAKEGMTREDFASAMAEDICPIDDVRASAAYRREVLTNLIYLHYQER
ncbi:MAG: xanthine dehydrogenase family protein subunit M [Lachnospiraceae bacterium]|nr:xanthine dehydrogenase family protein subunit M [Candidatus Equihabitans merdae]